MSRSTFVGRLWRILREAVAGQVPHDLAAQVPATSPPPPDLGALVRQLRLAAGLTRAEVAARAGLSETTLRNVELGIPARPETWAALQAVPCLRELPEQARFAGLDLPPGLAPVEVMP